MAVTLGPGRAISHGAKLLLQFGMSAELTFVKVWLIISCRRQRNSASALFSFAGKTQGQNIRAFVPSLWFPWPQLHIGPETLQLLSSQEQ